MDAEATLGVLRSLAPAADIHRSELGMRRDAAYLRIAVTEDDTRWAVLCSPGDRWVSLETEGGFSLDHFEEGISDADIRRILGDFMSLATAYLDGHHRIERRGRLGIPVLIVDSADGPAELRRSIAREIRDFFRPGH